MLKELVDGFGEVDTVLQYMIDTVRYYSILLYIIQYTNDNCMYYCN